MGDSQPPTRADYIASSVGDMARQVTALEYRTKVLESRVSNVRGGVLAVVDFMQRCEIDELTAVELSFLRAAVENL